jgi:charged multivesicular body protein 7
VNIGDQLWRDYGEYYSLPITTTEAKSMDWKVANSTCDPNLGIQYAYDGNQVGTEYPMALYFTKGGQVAGVGTIVVGPGLPDQLINKGYYQPIGNDLYFISVTFRDSSIMCSGKVDDSLALGDRLIINANGIAQWIPTTEQEAINGKWTKGSCFQSMGYHYFYDLVGHPNMTWYAANLLPVVPMYNNGAINAFFFASDVVQQGIADTHMWEPIPLADFLMCKNWCDSSCTWYDTSFWSTMHIYLNDYKKVNCPGDCTISCCP